MGTPTDPATDYIVRSVTRSPGGLVTYVVVTLLGQVTSVALRYRFSTPEVADPIIRRVVGAYPKRRMGP